MTWNVIPLRRGAAGGRANAQARHDERAYEHGGVPLGSKREIKAAAPGLHPRIVAMRKAYYEALDAGVTPEEARAVAMAVQG